MAAPRPSPRPRKRLERNRPPTPANPVAAWFSLHERLAFLLLSAAWVSLLFDRALFAPFVYDDLDAIVNNPSLSSPHAFVHRFLLAPVAFTGNLRGFGGSSFRPLFWLSLALDRALWGLNPHAFHLTNLLLHLAAGFAGFRLLRALRLPLPLSAGATLLWLSLPIHTEVVAWISARAYSLATLFLFLALLAAVRFLLQRSLLSLAFYTLAASAALLSHELGLLLLPLSALIALATDTPEVPTRGRWLTLAAIALLLDAASLTLKHLVGARSGSGAPWPLAAALTASKYLAWIVAPIHMSVERSTSTPPNTLSPDAIAAWIGLAALLALATSLRNSLPVVSAGIAWLALALGPFCGFVPLYQGMAERFTYLAAAGLALAVAAISFRYFHRAHHAVLYLVLLWVAWGIWRTETRLSDWQDPVALYRSSLVANPSSPALWDNLGFALRQQGDLAPSAAAYRRATEADPQYARAWASLGDAESRLGHPAEAGAAYGKTLALNPADLGALLNLAVLLERNGRPADAQTLFERAIALAADNSSAYTDLGVLFFEQGRTPDAARLFQQAIDHRSTDPTPYFDLAVLFQQSGRADLAIPLYHEVLHLKPGDPDTLANLRLLNHPR